MKIFMKIMSLLIAIAAVVIIIATAFDTGIDFSKFAIKVMAIVTANILPIISIAICAYCLERNDTNYLIRIIPIYMSIPILITLIMLIFETNASWLVDLYSFLSNTFAGVTALTLIMVIKDNNKITKIIKYITYGILILNVGLQIFANIKSSMVNTLPNVYGYQGYGGFNFSTVEETNEFISKVYSVSTIAELFLIILLYITNYAFSDKIELIEEDIDYEAIKQDALKASNIQMQQLNSINKQQNYNNTQENVPSNNGAMNIANQLGQNSNVGVVKEKAKEINVSGSSLDQLMTLSSGPVINQTINNETNQNVEQINQQEQVQAQQDQQLNQNLDIQEQMRQKIQQQQQNNNIK